MRGTQTGTSVPKHIPIHLSILKVSLSLQRLSYARIGEGALFIPMQQAAATVFPLTGTAR